MSITAEKTYCLSHSYTRGLQSLAQETGEAETVLLEKALETFFQQSMDEATYNAWEHSKETEAKPSALPSPRRAARSINPEDFTVTHEVRIAPEKIIWPDGAKR